jgi:hypothetical protein
MNLKSSPANSLVNLNRFKVVNLTGICTIEDNNGYILTFSQSAN